jgi:eukaryotic-like serine/threonine-protein kinase
MSLAAAEDEVAQRALRPGPEPAGPEPAGPEPAGPAAGGPAPGEPRVEDPVADAASVAGTTAADRGPDPEGAAPAA